MAQLPMYAAMVNSPGTELAADITATDTEISVLDATKLPDAPNLLTVGGDETAETIRYTGKTGNTLTGCTRGFEGATKGWAAGSQAARNHTAYDYEAGRANIAELDGRVTETARNYIRQPGYAVTTGTATAYIATLTPAPAVLTDGFGITIVPHIASGVSPTLNINGLGAIALKKQDGTAYAAGDLKANIPYTFRKVGSDFLADSGGGEVKITGQQKEMVIYGGTIERNDPILTTTVFSGIANPESLPTGAGTGVAFSPDGVYMVITHSVSPYIAIYKRVGDAYTKLANPAALPTGNANRASFSPDGVYLVVAHQTSPFITIYKRSGDTFSKLSDPAVLPTNQSFGVAFSADGTYLAVSVFTSPYVYFYKRSGDTFTKLADPAILPTAGGRGVAFSPDGLYVAFSITASPYLIVYKRSGDAFTKLADPTTLPTGVGTDVSFSSDGLYLAVAHTNDPHVSIYKRSGDVFTKLANPSALPTGNSTRGVAFNADSSILAVSNSEAPYIICYRRSGDNFTKMADISPLPNGEVYGLAFNPVSVHLVGTVQASPYLSMYKPVLTAYATDNSITSTTNATGLGYALESGSSGDTKNVVLIWR